jgi:hypothetical protein
MKHPFRSISALALTVAILTMVSTRLPADTGTCGGAMTTLPFTDVAGNAFFCQIAEAYFSGLTNGTMPTTYGPSDSVSRQQMAAFVTRTQDSALRRGSRNAALGRWDFPARVTAIAGTGGTAGARQVKSDGADLWETSETIGAVTRFRASDRKYLGTWFATNPFAVLVGEEGFIWVTGATPNSGRLYQIDPRDPPGDAILASDTLGAFPYGIATDGRFIWTSNGGGSVSKVDPQNPANPATLTNGFAKPVGILFDGGNLWVTDYGDSNLKKLDSNGSVIQVTPVGAAPQLPVFDGSNIWVPNYGSSTVTVVRARDGVVLATLTGNGLSGPVQAAFDGQFILVTNITGKSLSLWKAADITPVGSFSTSGYAPFGACSDGIHFWIALNDPSDGEAVLGRF